MKRFVVEYANEQKRIVKSMRKVYSRACINDMLEVIDKYVSACKRGLITETECMKMLATGHCFDICANGISEGVMNTMLFECDVAWDVYNKYAGQIKTKEDIIERESHRAYYKGMIDAYNNVLIGTNNIIALDLGTQAHYITNRHDD